MALTNKITNFLFDLRYKTRLNGVEAQDVVDVAKKQTFGFDSFKNSANSDLIEISTNLSQEILDDSNEENKESSFNFFA